MSNFSPSVLLLVHQATITRHDKSCVHHLRCRTSLALISYLIKFTVLTLFKTVQLAKLYHLASTKRMKAVQTANSDGPPVPSLPSSSSLVTKKLKTFFNGITNSQGISSIELWDNWRPRQSLETSQQKRPPMQESSVSPNVALMSS